MTESAIGFDPERHVYTVDGKTVPSVTSIMGHLIDYGRVPDDVLMAAADLGTRVHKATEVTDTMGLVSHEGDVIPYLDAWRRFLRDSGFQIELVEHQVYYPRPYMYAGTIDRVGILDGKRAILDIKTTARLHDGVACQLAAYMRAYNQGKPPAAHAKGIIAVQLRPDELYRVKDYSSVITESFNTFCACLTIQRWREKHQ